MPNTTYDPTADSAQWGIDAAAFHKQFDPLLTSAPANNVDPSSPVASMWNDVNNQNSNTGQITLANGKTWHPSGAGSGVIYHPVGEMMGAVTPTNADDANSFSAGIANQTPYWTVSGDLSAMNGKPDSNQHATIDYVEKDGKMIPMDAPSMWTWAKSSAPMGAVSYTHLTLPTNREV